MVTAPGGSSDPVVTADMRHHFETYGYVVVPQAVPVDQCAGVVDLIWEFTGYDRDDPASWYGPPVGLADRWPVQEYGMIPLFQHQRLWDNRQHPRLYRAFAELLDREQLWVSLDRVNMKPPHRPGDQEPTDRLVHWDVDTGSVTFPLPRPRPVQGVLCLTRTEAAQGGFHCLPGLYRDFQHWLSEADPDRDPWQPGPTSYERVAIEAEAGDLIIWDSLLAHGNGINRTPQVRFAQYITMEPADPGRTRPEAAQAWRDRTGPAWAAQDPRGWEARHCAPAVLSPLGRRLLGETSWATAGPGSTVV